ncbi:MAG: alpha/beta fold hydrolase [Armatimonadetes bacterium]|nr:alpha/beta fold hydrolase [Armatimonadota bacterium]
MLRNGRKLTGLALWAMMLCSACGISRPPDSVARAQQAEAATTPFDYDPAGPLSPTIAVTKRSPGAVIEQVEFNSPCGGRVAGLLIRPTAVERPPVILFLHGLGGSKKDAQSAAALLMARGVAVFGLDAACHGDRRKEGEEFFSADLQKTKDHIIQTVIDYRRAIDYLATRDDVDAGRVGLIGASLGAILGAMVAGVDQRVCAALLIVGGGNWRTIFTQSRHPAAEALRAAIGAKPEAVASIDDVDPVRYVGMISPRPLWMVNGKQDDIIPRAAAEALFEAAKPPKEIFWYEGGHVPPLPWLAGVVNDWIGEFVTNGAVKKEQAN